MLLYQLRRQLIAFVLESNIASILIAVAAYAVAAYWILYICNETQLLSFPDFIYWIIVTTSTVGYGDMSPETTAGKWATALFIIPAGLSLFGLTIAKIGLILSDSLTKEKRGLRLTNSTNHCVIIGWNNERTHKLINLISATQNGHKEKILLVAKEVSENPMPNQIEFVSVTSYTNQSDMQRANIPEAARIIIDTQQDDLTLATALFCRQLNEDCHKTVYFKEENMAGLLKPYCPNVEIIPSVSVEMLARSSIDPGSSILHQQLLDPNEGDSQYSSPYIGNKNTEFGKLFSELKYKQNAILLGYRKANSNEIRLNPNAESVIEPNDMLYYIAPVRLSAVQ